MKKTLLENMKDESFKKVTTSELRKLGYNITTHDECDYYSQYANYVKLYYPSTATKLLVKVHSEYNDETYDNRIQYVVVYDKDDNELLPLKGKELAARNQWTNLPIPTDKGTYDGSNTNDGLEDVVIYLSGSVPELFVKI